MSRFVPYYIAFVVLMNAAILSVLWHWAMSALAVVSLPLFYLGAVLKKTDESIKNVEGLDLGQGVDIEDPDLPVKTRVVLEHKALELGFLAIGGPGSGKSIGALVVLQFFSQVRKIGWVYWEGKGDKDIYQKACASGSRPDKFFSSELKGTDTTNVVSGPTEAVVEALTQTLITSESDYYRNAQREALRAVVPLLKAIGKPIILRDIYVALKVEEAAHYAIQLAEKSKVAPEVIEVARQFFEKDAAARANDINGLLTKMSLFVTGDIAERLNDYTPSLDLVEAAANGLKVYMHLPYSALSKDIAIMFTEQIGVIAKHRQLYDDERITWPQLFDDWGAFFYPNIGPITARCRSAKMPASYLFQSKGQTDGVDKAGIFTTEVTDNIGGFISFRINGQGTATWVAEQFGTYESKELSATDNSSYAGQNISTQEKPRIRGDVLKGLNAGEAYISCLISGEGGRSQNKRYRARFPMPDMTGAKDITWPEFPPRTRNVSTEGLNLWHDFMDKDRLAQLKKQVINDALQPQHSTDESLEFDDL